MSHVSHKWFMSHMNESCLLPGVSVVDYQPMAHAARNFAPSPPGAPYWCVAVCFALCCTVLMRVAASLHPRLTLLKGLMQCVALCRTVLHCIALRRTVLHCVAMCCNVLHCVASCWCVLQHRYIPVWRSSTVYCSVLQCVAVCCSVLQRAAVCCSVLQCAALCCSVL